MESNISSSFCDCGQMFYIVNNSNFEQLLYYINQNNTDVTGSTLIHYLKKNIDFAESHENFCCAITKISRQNSERHFWLPMLFYYYNFKWVRVAIESIKCPSCGWKGSIANPTLPYLYENIDNYFDLVDKCFEYSTVTCPCCGGVFNRFAIWVE